MTPRAAIFDLNGVLTRPPTPASWRRLVAIAGADDALLHGAYWRHRPAYDRADSTARAYWQLVGEAVGRTYSKTRVAALIRADAALWGRANEPVVRELVRLKRAGFRTAILSNTPREIWEQVARRHAWFSAADVKTLSFEVGETKPGSAIYLRCLDDLGVDPSEAWFVDDRPEFVAAATRVGIAAVQYTRADVLAACVARAFV